MDVALADQVAVLSGPAGGMRTALAARLEACGAAVVTLDGGRVDLLAALLDRFGRLDIVVNLALGRSGPAAAEVEAFCRGAGDVIAAPGGRILNIVPVLGVVPASGEAASSADAAGILALTRTLALDWGGRGILVNALAVGARDGDDPLAARLLSHTPLARPGTAAEIADAALFLLDPENSYTTGHVLVVDGGFAAGYARDF
jgi:hypothetical protein